MVRFSIPRFVYFRSLLQGVAGESREGSLSEAVEFLARTDGGDNKDAYYFLLRRCIKEKGLDEGRRLQGMIRHWKYDRDGFLGNLLIKLYGVCNSLEEARYIFDTLPASSSSIAFNNMLEAYVKNEKIDEAREFFDAAPKKNTKAWNIMLAAYAQRGQMHEAKELFKLDRDPPVELWVTMIEGYARAGKTQRAFTMFRAAPGDERVWGAMIAAFTQSGDLEMAKTMVHRMTNPSVNSCTPLFDAYLKGNRIEDAQDVFNKMSTEYDAPWTNLLMAYLDRGMFSESKRIFKLMPIKDPVAWNAMIRAHSVHGEIEEAGVLFEGMGSQRNVESWNIIMAAYILNGRSGDTFKIFKGMIQRYVKPDRNSFLIVMESCTNLDDAGKVAKEFRWSSCIRDLELNNTLMKVFLRLGSVEEATSVFHSIEEKDWESWSLMVSGLASKGRYKPAASLLSNMLLRGMMPDNGLFSSMISACKSLGRIDDAAKYIRCMAADFDVNPVVGDYLCVMQLLKPIEAEDLLSSMPFVPEYDAWKILLEVSERGGDENLAIVAEKALARGRFGKPSSIARRWSSSGAAICLLDCKRIHCELVKNSRSTEAESANSLIQMYGDCGALPEAWIVFEQIARRDVVSWNMMIRAFSKSRHLEEAAELFNRLPAANLVSWNLIVAAYNQESRIEASKLLFDRMPERNLMTGNSMVATYARDGHLPEAYMIFERMPEHSVITWTAMMVGLAKHSSIARARSLFVAMPERNAASWNAIIQAHARVGHIRDAEQFFARMPLHSVLSSTDLLQAYAQRGPDSLNAARIVFESIRCPDSICWNAMLRVYSSSGDPTAAKQVFDRCPNRTVVSWNNLIQALGQNGHFDAAKLVFDRIPHRDAVSSTILLSQTRALDEAKQIFDSMPERSVVPWTALVVASARAGDLTAAEESFAKSPELDEVAWSAMVSAYSLNGQATRALELFKIMDLEGLRIDSVSLLSVIDACSIVARVSADSSRSIIRELEPDLEAVFLGTEESESESESESRVAVGNALINLYGKAGQPGRSKAVFDRMVSRRNALSWTALLSAYAHSGLAHDCVEIFHLMALHDVAPDGVALMSVLSACSHAGMGGAAAEKLSVAVAEFRMAAAAEHFVCVADALGRAGEVAEAYELLERMRPDEAGVAAWMSLVAASVRVGDEVVAGLGMERIWEIDLENAASCIAMCLENQKSLSKQSRFQT